MCINTRKIIQNGEEITVKCGKCEICRLERCQEWAIKLINESRYHTKGVFVTLTFDNKILIKGNKYGANCSFLYNINNSKEYFKKFIKRLRKKYKGTRITYYHVGEYGEKTKRCHHHAILWGIDFNEFEQRKEMEISKSGHIQYYSKTLEELWACGRCSVQDINSNNIIYISQYSLKKFKNNENNKRYRAIQSFSNRSRMSAKWVRRNYKEITKGYIEDVDGKRYRIPRSYINELKKEKGEMKNALEKYEQNILERISSINNIELMEKQLNKANVLKERMKKKKCRDI